MDEIDKKDRNNSKFDKSKPNDYIDTPYPYCLMPKRHPTSDTKEGLSSKIDVSKDKEGGNKPLSVLSVSTWDGRELFRLKRH